MIPPKRRAAATAPTPTAARPLAAPVVAAGAVEPVGVPLGPEEAVPLPVPVPPVAAALKASYVLSVVGLMAKTIPPLQCGLQ